LLFCFGYLVCDLLWFGYFAFAWFMLWFGYLAFAWLMLWFGYLDFAWLIIFFGYLACVCFSFLTS